MSLDAWRAAVLLGTARSTATPPPPCATLAPAWARIDWTQREPAMLQAAALLAAARSAGALPLRNAAPLAPCTPETQPCAPPAAAACLRQLLRGEHAGCLPEWLRLASERGSVAAPRDLPALLDRGTQHVHLRTAIAAVVGQRGAWLARRHEAWRWLLGDRRVGDAAWTDGLPPERVQWLRQVHAEDPARAATALMATWGDDSGEQREAMLAIVARAPHASLESWLEQKPLRDRRSGIRQLARMALLRLPASAFRRRAIARAAPLLRLEGLLRRRLVVELPAAFDPAWQQDAIEEKPPTGFGPRAHWARQLLANVPLDHWLTEHRVDAAKWFAWSHHEESRDVLRLAWLDGMALAPHAPAAVAFAREYVVGDAWPALAPPRLEFTDAWLRELPATAARAVLDELLARFPADALLGELLLRGPLPHATGDPARLADGIVALSRRAPAGAREAEALALAVPAGEVHRLLRELGDAADLAAATEAFLRTLEFRQRLFAAFAAPTP